MEPILKGRNLTKRYGRVVALDNCDFDLIPGEILAVIGDNGAGKSTLIKASPVPSLSRMRARSGSRARR
jgi:fructose transport system ATP-binding protein